MRAFGETLVVEAVPDPSPPDDGVVVAVRATGVCRSDWHGWMGHDPAITLPHVPGHELAGEVAAAGPEVRGFAVGDRVTVPFCCGCGRCEPCRHGWTQICDADFQPGFTAWGSFAELVALPRADLNLVQLPEPLDFVEAASLGCRFMTAFAALTDVHAEDWVAVHGCGGLGLSAVMIASALGAAVVAVDVDPETLELARSLGAAEAVDARGGDAAEVDPDLEAVCPPIVETQSYTIEPVWWPPGGERCTVSDGSSKTTYPWREYLTVVLLALAVAVLRPRPLRVLASAGLGLAAVAVFFGVA